MTENFKKTITEAKPIYQKVINTKVITFMFISHTALLLISLSLTIAGMSLSHQIDKTIKLALTITGIVGCSLAILSFYTFEYIRRKANIYFTKAFNITNVLKLMNISDMSFTPSSNTLLNKEWITKYVGCQVVETYMTKEMDFNTINYKNKQLELGYFITSSHDVISHSNKLQTNIMLAQPYVSKDDCYITNHELREYTFAHCQKQGDLYIYTNNKDHPIDKKIIKLAQKLAANQNKPFDILLTNNRLTLFLLRDNHYLCVGHKSYNFWKKIHPYLNEDLDKDVMDFINTLNYFVL